MHHYLILNKIRKSSLGVFYKKKLKKYIFLRIFFNFIFWRLVYLSITNFLFLLIKNNHLVNLNLNIKSLINLKIKKKLKLK